MFSADFNTPRGTTLPAHNVLDRIKDLNNSVSPCNIGFTRKSYHLSLQPSSILSYTHQFRQTLDMYRGYGAGAVFYVLHIGPSANPRVLPVPSGPPGYCNTLLVQNFGYSYTSSFEDIINVQLPTILCILHCTASLRLLERQEATRGAEVCLL